METPRLLSVSDYEQYATGKLDKGAEAHIFNGSFYEQTLQDNVKAFTRYRFRPRVLRDVSKVDTSSPVLEHLISCPVGVSPMGGCVAAHPDGELGIAKACARLNLPFVLSINSNHSIEDISRGAPDCVRWFQLYIFDWEVAKSLVRRAEEAGFSALVLTVDGAAFGRCLAQMKAGFKATPHKRGNYDMSIREGKAGCGASITWEDLKFLMNFTKLPVILKGIMTGEDAREAVSHGVAAVWVSNHGGRNLDGLPASIDVLSEVVDAVAGRCEVYMDGGVRSGYDVVKAIALGARAVFMGRPAMWGLICQGTEGVENMLKLVQEEVVNAMQLLGVKSWNELGRNYVVHESRLPKV